MKRRFLLKIIGIIFFLLGFGLFSRPVLAATEATCFCSDYLHTLTKENASKFDNYYAQCLISDQVSCLKENFTKPNGARFDDCHFAKTVADCQGSLDLWENNRILHLKDAGVADPQAFMGETRERAGGLFSKLIPPCALDDTVKGDCRNINIFVTLAIRVSTYLFSIIGGVSLVMFVYGGFLLVLSEGSEEKITQAKEVLTAVVIGLLIAFGGYLLIKFVGQVVGIDQAFRLK